MGRIDLKVSLIGFLMIEMFEVTMVYTLIILLELSVIGIRSLEFF